MHLRALSSRSKRSGPAALAMLSTVLCILLNLATDYHPVCINFFVLLLFFSSRNLSLSFPPLFYKLLRKKSCTATFRASILRACSWHPLMHAQLSLALGLPNILLLYYTVSNLCTCNYLYLWRLEKIPSALSYITRVLIIFFLYINIYLLASFLIFL